MSHTFSDAGSAAFGAEEDEHGAFGNEEFFDIPELKPLNDLVDYAKEYAREKPEVAALCCFGLGFILGWKLKPW